MLIRKPHSLSRWEATPDLVRDPASGGHDAACAADDPASVGDDPASPLPGDASGWCCPTLLLLNAIHCEHITS